jgi:NADPH-dependent 2,4-dienoyl-CoA reductase/sulfur reductase-like enzyme
MIDPILAFAKAAHSNMRNEFHYKRIIADSRRLSLGVFIPTRYSGIQTLIHSKYFYTSSIMEKLPDPFLHSHLQAAKPYRIVVVGAGIAGISAGLALSRHGHSVTILESSSQLGETGAGIQLAPNATRILQRLDILDEVMLNTTILSGVSVR